MALITNNISGSSSNSSKIGITGSIIIGNAPDNKFPTLGSDAVFFVSGSETSKSVFGGSAQISGSLTTDSSVTLGNSSDDTITITGTSVFLQPIGIKGDETADNAKIHFKASDNTNRFTIETDFDASTANDLLGFRSTTTDNILVLKGTGNVGIGTTSPTPTFIVSGSSTATTTTTLIKGGAPNQTGPIFEVDNNNDTTLLLVSGSGNITVGTTSLSSLVSINAGSNIVISGGTTGNVLLNNTATTNTIALGGTSQTGAITIGQSTTSNTINIGNGTIDPAATQTIQIAGGSTGTARSVINIGSSSGSGALTLRAGTGNITLTAGTTGGAIVVGDSTVSNTVSIGNSTTATGATQTINIATAATGTGKALISMGNTNGASGLILSAGTGGITISSSTGGNIIIGNAATTGTIAIGATGQTGTITIGQSTDTNTINIGAAATANTKSQNVNIANATASGGIANVNIANSSAGTNTITIGKFGTGTVNVVLGGDAIKIGDSANTDLGFFNTTPAPKQTPASDTLANLYTALRAYGLIG